MVFGERFVADTCVFVVLLRLCEILVGHNLVFDERLHSFVFLFGYFVSDSGTLYGVTVGDVVRRNSHQRSAATDAHSFRHLAAERNDSGHRGYSHRFVALGSEYLSACLDDLLEGGRCDGIYLYTGSVSFRFREDDFIAVLAGGFAGGSFAVIVSSAAFTFV